MPCPRAPPGDFSLPTSFPSSQRLSLKALFVLYPDSHPNPFSRPELIGVASGHWSHLTSHRLTPRSLEIKFSNTCQFRWFLNWGHLLLEGLLLWACKGWGRNDITIHSWTRWENIRRKRERKAVLIVSSFLVFSSSFVLCCCLVQLCLFPLSSVQDLH